MRFAQPSFLDALRWSSGEWSKARGSATVRPDQSRPRLVNRFRLLYLRVVICAKAIAIAFVAFS
jgi:hypothetical protein